MAYSEGTLVRIPVRDTSEWRLGLIARLSKRGRRGNKVMAVYCFLETNELTGEVRGELLRQDETVLFAIVGDHAVRTGKWPVCGEVADFVRGSWPVLPLSYMPTGMEKGELRLYNEDDLADWVGMKRIAREEVVEYFHDALHTPSTLEHVLGRIQSRESIHSYLFEQAFQNWRPPRPVPQRVLAALAAEWNDFGEGARFEIASGDGAPALHGFVARSTPAERCEGWLLGVYCALGYAPLRSADDARALAHCDRLVFAVVWADRAQMKQWRAGEALPGFERADWLVPPLSLDGGAPFGGLKTSKDELQLWDWTEKVRIPAAEVAAYFPDLVYTPQQLAGALHAHQDSAAYRRWHAEPAHAAEIVAALHAMRFGG